MVASNGRVERVLALGQRVMAWVTNGVQLWGSYMSSGGVWSDAVSFDTTSMLITGNRYGTLIDLHIISHDALDQTPVPIQSMSAGYQGAWLLFSFLTPLCGGVSFSFPVRCTGLERFIFLSEQELPALPLPNNYAGESQAILSAVSPINTWGGDNFNSPSGDNRWSSILATASLTEGVIGNSSMEWLYWSAITYDGTRPVIVQYLCQIYAVTEPTKAHHDDTPYQMFVQTSGQDLQCGVTSLAFANHALYGFAPCMGILQWAVTVDSGLSSGIPKRVITPDSLNVDGVLLGLFQMLPVVRSALLLTSALGAVGSKDANAFIMHVDLVNLRTWRAASGVDVSSVTDVALARALARDARAIAAEVPRVHMTVGAGGRWVISMADQLHVSNDWDICGVDQVSFDKSTCEYMQCVLLETTRMSKMSREIGNVTFVCTPGYAMSETGACTVCTIGSYCSHGVKRPCASSMTTLSPGAASSAACVCKVGFYTYASGVLLNDCLPCSADAWCVGGSRYPVACAFDAVVASGFSSPLDCSCASGTSYGLRCVPCDTSSECYPPDGETHALLALQVSAWGVAGKAGDTLNACLQSMSSDWIVYDMPDVAPLYNTFIGNDVLATLTIDSGIFPLGWVIVAQDMRNSSASLVTCMERSAAVSNANVTFMDARRRAIAERVPCGLHVEVDSNHRCSLCVAGYETRYVQQYLTCVPCLNGTFRVRWSVGGCIPCADNNSHAPSMGMSRCACKDGFYLPVTSDTSYGTSTVYVNRASFMDVDSSVLCIANPERLVGLALLSNPLYLGLIVCGSIFVFPMVCYLLSLCVVG